MRRKRPFGGDCAQAATRVGSRSAACPLWRAIPSSSRTESPISFIKSRLALAALLGVTSLATVAGTAVAQKAPPAAAGSPVANGAFADLRPAKVEKGNASVPVIKKKRAGGTHEVPSRDLLIKWFTEMNITHSADEAKIVLPFRDDATALNLNLVLIPRMKPTGSMWAVQAAVPIGVPIPAGEPGYQKAVRFANTWNNENFLIKVSLMTPAGGQPFFLLDSALPCEDGLSKGEFFQNFVGILVQTSQLFIQKATAAMSAM